MQACEVQHKCSITHKSKANKIYKTGFQKNYHPGCRSFALTKVKFALITGRWLLLVYNMMLQQLVFRTSAVADEEIFIIKNIFYSVLRINVLQ